ncbi:MAG: hypothetical protein A2Z11_03665 [Candidatus Woykebacteria bacterium RBG_16_43_9]|uniref:Uncharacterized protein n=1 Tax=Candidatus Woykebacteria bacterium RBG_16_43_9 TaxID=1802596 RepID=A0A1G1WCS9_9BACT|nr:MAG: hypothetical protein A2Z11_03665 [Candidatus Woykebacteria bacterium RBG_16_43_9]
MLLSPELDRRLGENKDLLQNSALLLVRRLIVEEKRLSPDEFARRVDTSPEKVSTWLLDTGSPGYQHSWKILEIAAEDFLPVEWIVRGDLLDEYNDKKRVPLLRRMIVKIGQRLTKDGESEEGGKKGVHLLVESGTLAFLELGSWPGLHRIWLHIRTLGEDYQIVSQRIGKDDRTVGGLWELHLPQRPMALNVGTIPVYLVGHDHTFTIRDVEEMIRWIGEGEKVDQSFIDQTQKNTWLREAVS